jgi:hypothetical protein
MIVWATVIISAINMLKSSNCKKPLPSMYGAPLYDYINDKQQIQIAEEERNRIWNEVCDKYKNEYGVYSVLFKKPLAENKTIIGHFKGELVRHYLLQNEMLKNELFQINL